MKRSEKALTLAETALENARRCYVGNEIQKGDSQLEDMTTALNECLSALNTVHKAKLYKKAELRVSHLQRRLRGLLDDIAVTQRGWAEHTDQKLEEIHDKLLEGAMRK